MGSNGSRAHGLFLAAILGLTQLMSCTASSDQEPPVESASPLLPSPSPTSSAEEPISPATAAPTGPSVEPKPPALSPVPAIQPSPSPQPTTQAQLAETDGTYQRNTPFVPLDNPVLLTAQEATYLPDNDLVLGLEWQGEVRAYPIRMLRYHHIVNDTVAGQPLLITY